MKLGKNKFGGLLCLKKFLNNEFQTKLINPKCSKVLNKFNIRFEEFERHNDILLSTRKNKSISIPLLWRFGNNPVCKPWPCNS